MQLNTHNGQDPTGAGCRHEEGAATGPPDGEEGDRKPHQAEGVRSTGPWESPSTSQGTATLQGGGNRTTVGQTEPMGPAGGTGHSHVVCVALRPSRHQRTGSAWCQ